MLNKYLDYLRYELNRAPLTVEAYGRDIKEFQDWLSPSDAENLDYASVTSSDVRAWLASVARSGESPRTLRRKIISLRTFFRWMQKTNVIKHSPLQDVPLPKLPKPLPDIIKPSEIEEALLALKETKEDGKEYLLHSLIIEMFYTLGIRRAELIAIDDSDISFIKGEIKVTGKRSKHRVIPVPEKLMAKIKEWQITLTSWWI